MGRGPWPPIPSCYRLCRTPCRLLMLWTAPPAARERHGCGCWLRLPRFGGNTIFRSSIILDPGGTADPPDSPSQTRSLAVQAVPERSTHRRAPARCPLLGRSGRGRLGNARKSVESDPERPKADAGKQRDRDEITVHRCIAAAAPPQARRLALQL